MAAKFGVFVDENHDDLPVLNWLFKFHKSSYTSCVLLFLIRVLLPHYN